MSNIKKWQDRVAKSGNDGMTPEQRERTAMQSELAELRTAVEARDKTYGIVRQALHLFEDSNPHTIVGEPCVSANLLLVQTLIVLLNTPSFNVMAADFKVDGI